MHIVIDHDEQILRNVNIPQEFVQESYEQGYNDGLESGLALRPPPDKSWTHTEREREK